MFANIKTILLLSGLFTYISCKPAEPPKVELPTNLTMQITTNRGDVSVEVAADKANFYTVIFYDLTDSLADQSNDGLSSYTYANTGTYIIKARAHTDYANYIELVDSVYIDLEVDTSAGYQTPMSYPGYTLVWNDEFDGNALSSDWTLEIGTGNSGWGNNELQYYTNKNHIVANGVLKITAKEENFGGGSYTSTRMITQGAKSFKYGRIDIRAQLPQGKGIWPALWMLGDNFSTIGWPQCGEIDIMELIGGGSFNDRTIYGTIHWEDGGAHQEYGNGHSLASGVFADEFHVFSIVWDNQTIKWYRDDILFNTADITPASLSEFHENFFFIFNIAVGGNWPGSRDATTIFPQSMYVDYIRVFQ